MQREIERERETGEFAPVSVKFLTVGRSRVRLGETERDLEPDARIFQPVWLSVGQRSETLGVEPDKKPKSGALILISCEFVVVAVESNFRLIAFSTA